MIKTVDYSALKRSISTEERASFVKSYADLLQDYRWMKVGCGVTVTTFFLFSIFLLLQGFYDLSIALIITGVVLMGLGLLILAMSRTALRVHLDRRISLAELASTNSWQYTMRTIDIQEQGLLFQQGRDHIMTDVVHAPGMEGRPAFQFGNYRYTIGRERFQRTHQWGYIAITLQRQLPHMLLDATANNERMFGHSASNLPTTFAKDQVLSLEGDFNSHFTLYAPKQYERDAFYIFTPDLMALLIDTTKAFDVEVIGDKMYVYMSLLDVGNERDIRQIMSIIDTVGSKTHRQTARYTDEFVGDRSKNSIAPAGARLRKRPFALIVVCVTVVAFALYVLYVFAILE